MAADKIDKIIEAIEDGSDTDEMPSPKSSFCEIPSNSVD
jgi:hypothetical protein